LCLEFVLDIPDIVIYPSFVFILHYNEMMPLRPDFIIAIYTLRLENM